MKLSGEFDLITSSVLHCPRNTPMRNKVGITGIAYEMAAMVLLEEWNIVVVFFQENKEPPWGTCEQTLWHAQTPERTGKPLFGNKAFSPLLCVVGVPTKVLLDYMHLILASEFLRRLLAWSSKRQWIPRRVQGWGWCGIAKCEVSTWFQPKVKTHKWTKEMERWRVAEFLSPCELAITKTFFPGDYFCNINFEHGPLILHSSIVFEDMISHLKRQFHST